ncbi:MAG: hypothetical protein HY791_31485 [Deltaproteobacteria bacterium]|nr:hypothetical protein [Deltaproteobacteria bacterium]
MSRQLSLAFLLGVSSACLGTTESELGASRAIVVAARIVDGVVAEAEASLGVVGLVALAEDGVVIATLASEDLEWMGDGAMEPRALLVGESAPAGSCGRCLLPAELRPWLVSPGEVCRIPKLAQFSVLGGVAADAEAAAIVRRDVRIAFGGDCRSPEPELLPSRSPRAVSPIWPLDWDGGGVFGFSSGGSILQAGPAEIAYTSTLSVIRLPVPGLVRSVISLGGERFLLAVPASKEGWRGFVFDPKEGLWELGGLKKVALTRVEADESVPNRFRVLAQPLGALDIAIGGDVCDIREREAACVPLTANNTLSQSSGFRHTVRIGELLFVLAETSARDTVAVAVGRSGQPSTFVDAVLPQDLFIEGSPISVAAALEFRGELVLVIEQRGQVELLARAVAPDDLPGAGTNEERALRLGLRWRKLLDFTQPGGWCDSAAVVSGRLLVTCRNGRFIEIDERGAAELGESLADKLGAQPFELRRVEQRGEFVFATNGPGGTVFRARSGEAVRRVLGPDWVPEGPLYPALDPGRGFVAFGHGGQIVRVIEGVATATVSAAVPRALSAIATGEDGRVWLAAEGDSADFVVGEWAEGEFRPAIESSSPFVSISPPLALDEAGTVRSLEDGAEVAIDGATDAIRVCAFGELMTTGPFKHVRVSGRVGYAVGCGAAIVRLSRPDSGWRGELLEVDLAGELISRHTLTRPRKHWSALKVLAPDLLLVGTEGDELDEERGELWLVTIEDGESGPRAVGRALSDEENPSPLPLSDVDAGHPWVLDGPLSDLVVAFNSDGEHTVRTLGSAARRTGPRSLVDGAYDPVSGDVLLGTVFSGLIVSRRSE